MAVITSATSGNYGTGATWVGGIAPVEGDSVVIARTSSGLETFSTNATGYAIGATAITLTGTVLAGSFVIGESVQFGSIDPNYYTITNWNSVTKVLTVSALIVAIPASATLVKCRGHVVTVDGTYIAGNDTTTAFTVNGTLRASRSVNSQLTVKGQLFTAATVSATIDYGRKSLGDTIPSTITANIIVNYSAAMVNFKYGLYVADTSNFYGGGATKTNNARLTADLAAAGTSVTVDDATGWAVNDMIVFASSSGTANQYDKRTILTITPGAGTTATITFAAVTYLHGTNCPIGNFTKNVSIKNYNTATYSFICFSHTSTVSNNRRELNNVQFERVGSNTVLPSTQVFVSSTAYSVITPFLSCANITFYNGCHASGLFFYIWNSGGFFLDNWSFFGDDGSNGAVVYPAATSFIGLRNSVFYYSAGVPVNSGYSQGGQGCLYEDNVFCSGDSVAVNNSNGDGSSFTRCSFHTFKVIGYTRLEAGSGKFINCNFGSLTPISPCPTLWGTPASNYIQNQNVGGIKGEWIMTDCCFITPSSSFNYFTILPNPQWILKVENKNLDPLVQEIYTPSGNIVRDNTSKISGVTSLKMSPTSSTNALTFQLKIPAPTGKRIGVSGYLWRDTANVTTVTLSGLGITPSVYTASGALSANEQFFVSGTQVTGTDGVLTLTISTIGTTGNLWVDSVSAPQAVAIDFGEFGFWTGGLPTTLMTASFVSAGDIWNFLLTNVNVSGSIGKQLKDYAKNVLKI